MRKAGEFHVDTFEYTRGKKVWKYKRQMDGVCVSNAIAATCGPAVLFVVGRETDKKDGV